jgi:hypothetical protein
MIWNDTGKLLWRARSVQMVRDDVKRAGSIALGFVSPICGDCHHKTLISSHGPLSNLGRGPEGVSQSRFAERWLCARC